MLVAVVTRMSTALSICVLCDVSGGMPPARSLKCWCVSTALSNSVPFVSRSTERPQPSLPGETHNVGRCRVRFHSMARLRLVFRERPQRFALAIHKGCNHDNVDLMVLTFKMYSGPGNTKESQEDSFRCVACSANALSRRCCCLWASHLGWVVPCFVWRSLLAWVRLFGIGSPWRRSSPCRFGVVAVPRLLHFS